MPSLCQQSQSKPEGTLVALQRPVQDASFRRPLTHGVGRLVVIDDYSLARGGATALALACAKGMRAANIPVVYLCGDEGDNEELRTLGIEVVALGQKDLLHTSRMRAFTVGLHNLAARHLIEQWIARFDDERTVYHVHGWSKILSPSIFAALKPVARRCVIHAHDFFAACPNGSFYDYRRNVICERRPLSSSCVLARCDKRSYAQKLWRVARGSSVAAGLSGEPDFAKIVLLHPQMVEFFVRSGYDENRLTTIRNPAGAFTTERICAEANDEFVFIGRLDEEKGIEDVLTAVEKSGVRLKVIGDGPLIERVRASTGDVKATGWLSHAEIAGTISSARALVMGSRYPEPFGMVAIEAAKSGLPVILPKSAFLAGEMTAAGFAISCDTRDADAFAHVLTDYARFSETEVKGMSERAYSLSPAFSLNHDTWCVALQDEYHDILGREALVTIGRDR